jgi:hypothetical protein
MQINQEIEAKLRILSCQNPVQAVAYLGFGAKWVEE